MALCGLLSSAAMAEPLVVDHGRLFIAAEIGGVATEALLDSGAEASLIDPALAAEAGLPQGQEVTIRGSGGEQKARLIPDVSITAIGRTIHPEAVVVMDLGDLSRRLIKRPTRAVVGREIFDSGRLLIDIEGKRVEAVGDDAVPPGKRIALTAHAGIEAIPVMIDEVPAQAEFDLGNGSGVLVSRAMATRLGLQPVGKTAGGGIGGEVQRDTVVLKSLTVGDTVFRDVPASVDDQPNANDLNIGTSILRNFLITTDFAKRAIWLQPREQTVQ